MNSRLQRIKDEDEAFRKARKGLVRKPFLTIVMCAAIIMALTRFGPFESSSASEAPQDSGIAQPWVKPKPLPPPEPVKKDRRGDWNLLLVNTSSNIKKDFTVDLKVISGYKVDVRIATSLQSMVAAAKKSGVSLSVCSGYRSVSKQATLYKNKVAYYRGKGYNAEQSAKYAGRYVQPSGASEHHTGLAIDFLTAGQSSLTERFAKTSAYKWLSEHAAEYGFVERYAKDKESFTGIAWEPWHYRYVGTYDAAQMKKSKLCLEEYVKDPVY